MLATLLAYFQVKIVIPVLRFVIFLLIPLSSLLFHQPHWPRQADVSDGESFDFVIVGGGSAGCVVANRLTEVANWSVLLIEAGDDAPYIVDSPGLSTIMGSQLPDWSYYTMNDGQTAQEHKTKNILETQGRMLGGSSTLNFMFYVRGNKADYDDWVARGNPGWDWTTVTKYFKKSEHLIDFDIMNSTSAPLHNTEGYMVVTRPLWSGRTKDLFNAFKEQGHDILVDTNGYHQLGFSPPTFTADKNKRQSTAVSFLNPIINRQNLHILKNTLAKKIIFDNFNNAIGVEVKTHSGQILKIRATKEVIVSSGSINTPQLLMVSGVGPKKHLKKHSIKTLIDLPGVGGNLQNHMLVPVMLTGKKSLLSIIDNLESIMNLDKFPVPSVLGHVALDRNQTYPDYQVIAVPTPIGSILPTMMCSEVFKYTDNVCTSIAEATNKGEAFFNTISFLHPESRGQIKLRSSDIEDPPIIETGYFSNEDDLEKFASCLKDFTSVINTTYFKSVESEIVRPDVKQCRVFSLGSQEYWKCYVLNLVGTQFHPVGTAAMGPEGIGVVDERLRVRGAKQLRIVDASVMPTITSGNTNAPVIMIAEKASDMIKVDNGICEDVL